MEKNVKRKIRFLLPVFFACLMAFSGIFVPTFNGSTTGLENKNVMFEAEGLENTLFETSTLTEVGEGNSRTVTYKAAMAFGDSKKDTNGTVIGNSTKTILTDALAGAESSGKGIIYRYHSAPTTMGTNACSSALVFKKPVDADIVTSITLRLYLYLSDGTEFYSNNTFGYAFMLVYGLGDTGENNSGYVVHRTTKQKEWIDLTISGANLAKLATQTDDGLQFKGMQVGFRAHSTSNATLYTGTPNQLNGFVILDHITYEVDEAVVKQKEAIAHKNQVTKNGTTLLASADQASHLVDGNLTTVQKKTITPPSASSLSSISVDGAANSSVWKRILHSGGAVIATPGIEFSKPVKVEEIESISIRLNAHLSAGSTYCTSGDYGIFITGLEQTTVVKGGDAKSSHMLVSGVQQDAWIDYSIRGNELNYLVDSDGNISGIQIACYVQTGDAQLFHQGATSANASWLLIDYIYYTPKYKASFEYEGAAITEIESYTTAEKVVLPSFTQNVDEVFVGWKQVVGNETYLYRAGKEITLTENTTFSAVTVDFDMVKGASIRVSDNAADSGIRFACTIDAADYAALGEFAQGFGTMILPTESIAQKDFVMENFDPEKNEILIIEGEKYDNETIPGYTLYTGVMVNIKQANYAKEFSARGYIKIAYTNGDVGYIYTDYNATNNSRSISSVAQKILDSGNSEYADVQIVKDYAAAANQ